MPSNAGAGGGATTGTAVTGLTVSSGSTGITGANAATATNQAATATNQATGGGGAHLNTQPTIIFSVIIKLRCVPRGIDGLMVPVN